MRTDVDPSVWGSSGWAFLRNCLNSSDAASRPYHQQLLRLLPEVLPCGRCRRHSREYLGMHPPEQAPNLSGWLRDFEEAVRRRTSEEPRSSALGSGPLLACVLLAAALAVAVALLWPQICTKVKLKHALRK